MKTISVPLGERSYPIVVRSGALSDAASLLDSVGLGGRPLFIVTDDTVSVAQAGLLEALQSLPGHPAALAVMPAGEESKSIQGFSFLIDRLTAFENGRGAIVIAVGGGVIGDLSGFTAACYKRGIPWVQVPTTLLAQVDASVGGKTALNHPSAKNLIGAFHQPSLVIADLDVLSTLPPRELRSGMAEVIKHGVIADAEFFCRIEKTLPRALKLDRYVLEDYVATSCQIKAAIVGQDERDTTGKRAILNYGHTFGHAIELARHFELSHGEAIAIGMACAGDLGVRLGVLSPHDAACIEAAVQLAGLPVGSPSLNLNDVLAAMRLDKKFAKGVNRFVIARSLGHVELHSNVPASLIQDVLAGRLAS